MLGEQHYHSNPVKYGQGHTFNCAFAHFQKPIISVAFILNTFTFCLISKVELGNLLTSLQLKALQKPKSKLFFSFQMLLTNNKFIPTLVPHGTEL